MLDFIKTLYDVPFGETGWRTKMNAFLASLSDYFGAAAGTRSSIAARLDESLNPDGSLKAEAEATSLWNKDANSPTYASASTFTVSGDRAGVYATGRAVRISDGVDLYDGRVTSASYAAGTGLTTVTVDGTVPATVAQVWYGQEVANSPSLLGGVDIEHAVLDNESTTLSVGYPTDEYDHGTVSSGTITTSLGLPSVQKLVNNGAFALAPPASESGHLEIWVTNGASAGAITTSGFTKVDGATYETTSGKVYLFQIARSSVASVLNIEEVS